MRLEEVYILVKTRKQICRVNTNEILYIETDRRLIVIHTISKLYTYYGRLDDVYQQLGEEFYKCHSRCILNLDRVISMKEGLFYLEGGKTLRIGQNYYQYAKKRFNEFLTDKMNKL